MKLRSTLATALLACAAFPAAAQNIVLILSDDQGWTGTSVQMDARVRNSVSDLYRTPSLERLAAEGMTFSNAYSPAPNCSPTRMSIQTGKTAARLGATDIIDVVPDEEGRAGIQFFYDAMYVNKPMNVPLPISDLADEEVTIAEFLKAHDPDYATGHFGKWHMGGENPELHGYDAHNGITTNAPGDQGLPDPKRTDEVTDETVRFIAEQAAAGKPFFVQASYYAVHTPVLAKAETVQDFNGLIVPEPPTGGPFGRFVNLVHTNTVYAGMTADLDAGVGRILDALDEHGLADSTYVIYTSDNGGESDLPVTSNVPLAWGKTHVWEGGIRVPLFIRGPGIDGGTRSDVPAIGYDFFATIADWVGASAAATGEPGWRQPARRADERRGRRSRARYRASRVVLRRVPQYEAGRPADGHPPRQPQADLGARLGTHVSLRPGPRPLRDHGPVGLPARSRRVPARGTEGVPRGRRHDPADPQPGLRPGRGPGDDLGDAAHSAAGDAPGAACAERMTTGRVRTGTPKPRD